MVPICRLLLSRDGICDAFVEYLYVLEDDGQEKCSYRTMRLVPAKMLSDVFAVELATEEYLA